MPKPTPLTLLTAEHVGDAGALALHKSGCEGRMALVDDMSPVMRFLVREYNLERISAARLAVGDSEAAIAAWLKQDRLRRQHSLLAYIVPEVGRRFRDGLARWR